MSCRAPWVLACLLLGVTACARHGGHPGSGGGTSSASPNCGFSPGDWCASPPGDACGQHKNTAACRADPACVGMGYRGESAVACQIDKQGFATNCPTVGCVSRARQ